MIGELYTMINSIKTRVVNVPVYVVTPPHQTSAARSQPLNRQQVMQLQYDATATPTSSRPQEWSHRNMSLQNELEDLQLDQAEAAASIPAPTRTRSGVVTRHMARSTASSSQLNSTVTAEDNATYP
jgi:hypothetical protein